MTILNKKARSHLANVAFLWADVVWFLSQASLAQSGSNDSAESLGRALAILIFFGTFAGTARALHPAPLGQSSSNVLAESLGRALALVGVTYAWSYIHAAMPTEHANLIEDLVDTAMIRGAEATRALRKQTEAFQRLAVVEAGSGGSGFAKAKYIALEALMHFFVGVVDGALTGMQQRQRW